MDWWLQKEDGRTSKFTKFLDYNAETGRRNWADVNRVAMESIRGEAKEVSRSKNGDYIIPSGNTLVYAYISKSTDPEIRIKQIVVVVVVDEDSEIEDTNHQLVFSAIIRSELSEKFGRTEQYSRLVASVIGEMLHREVNVRGIKKKDYRTNWRNGYARQDRESKGGSRYSEGMRNRAGDFGESSNLGQVRSADRNNVKIISLPYKPIW